MPSAHLSLRASPMLLKKSCSQIRRWNPALVFLAEPIVSVACDPIIHSIAKKTRHDDEHGQQLPDAVAISRYAQGGGRTVIDSSIIDKKERMRSRGREVKPTEDFPSGVALQCSKGEHTAPVVADDEANTPGAKIADTVEEDNLFSTQFKHTSSTPGTTTQSPRCGVRLRLL